MIETEDTISAPAKVHESVPKRGRSARAYDGELHRQAILQAAIDTFGLLGYDGASTRRIAAAANIEQGHLAYYYPTKEALWRDAICLFASGVEKLVRSGMSAFNGRNAVETARDLLPRFLAHCAATPRLTRLMLQEFSIESARHEWVVETFGKPIWRLFQPLFEALSDEELLSGAPPAVAYFNFLGASLVTFGNPEVTMRIAGMDAGDAFTRDQHIALIMCPILQRRIAILPPAPAHPSGG